MVLAPHDRSVVSADLTRSKAVVGATSGLDVLSNDFLDLLERHCALDTAGKGRESTLDESFFEFETPCPTEVFAVERRDQRLKVFGLSLVCGPELNEIGHH